MTNELVSSPPIAKRSNAKRADLYLTIGLPMTLLVLVVIFSIATPTFAHSDNLTSMIRSASVSALMFMGLTWVFAIGEIDVSFVSVASLCNMLVAGLISNNYSWAFACAVALVAGVGVGIANGLLVAYLRLPSLVTTVATGGISTALAAAIGHGSSISIGVPEILRSMETSQIGPIPVLAILCGLAYFGAWYVQEKLRVGHYIYATAENRQAVVEAGIPVKVVVLSAFVLSALCGVVGGLLLTIELSSGQPSVASTLFLDGLTAVLLGGTMLRLGRPNVLGTLFSVLVLTVLIRGGALLGWSDAIFQTIKGALLLVGIFLITYCTDERRETQK
jgi:ribose transport system permease protein